jgi:hypothetical protein
MPAIRNEITEQSSVLIVYLALPFSGRPEKSTFIKAPTRLVSLTELAGIGSSGRPLLSAAVSPRSKFYSSFHYAAQTKMFP